MNQFFSRLPLLTKLLIIALVPIAFIIILTIQVYREKSSNLTQIERYQERIEESFTITAAIDQLQQERRFSAEYAQINPNNLELLEQRRKTDSMLSVIDQFANRNFYRYRSYTFPEPIDSVRSQIDDGSYSTNHILDYYTGAAYRLNKLYSTPSMNNEFLSQLDFNLASPRILSNLITHLDILNARVYHLLYAQKYDEESIRALSSSYHIYQSFEREFLIKADSVTSDKYHVLTTHSAFKLTSAYLKKIFSSLSVDTSMTFRQWNNISTLALDELRALQSDLLHSAKTQIHQFYVREKSAKNQAVFLLVAVSLFILFLALYMVLLINRSLKQLQDAALKIADGDTEPGELPRSKDSIGSLAESIRRINEKNKTLALASQLIGDGNFDIPFSPRSPRDLLGNAIISMKQNLQQRTAELRKSREEFMQLADFMPQIVFISNKEGKVEYYNRKWYEYTSTTVKSGAESWIPYIHASDVSNVVSNWYAAIEKDDIFEMEYRIRGANDNYRWFLGRALPIRNNDGEILRWFGTATDIDDHKQQHVYLEEQVAQRTVELSRSNEDLQQFAHVASHDLKEPQRKIRLFGERIAFEFGHLLPEKGRIYLNKLRNSSERMTNMIDSVLNYSLVDSTEPSKERIDLNNVLADIENDLELMIIQKNVRITSAKLPVIYGIPTLIHQLFYNLINNSLKFSDDEKTSFIEISSEEFTYQGEKDWNELQQGQPYHHIILKDNGIGFKQDQAENMFKAFTRLISRDKYEGTGLGLALCRKIVVRHNGLIYATGEEGAGADFHVILPAD